MTPGPEPDATDDREAIEAGVRRVVGISALRRIRGIIDERREADRVMRSRVAPIAAIVMIAVAALIWFFGTARADREEGSSLPLPECAPPRQNITI